MTRMGKLFFSLLVLTLVVRVGVACELTGSYVLKWDQTHGGQPRNDFRVDLVSAGAEPRPVFEGVQATAKTDCQVDVEGSRSRYLLPFDDGMYLSLGWGKQHESAQLTCYWNDLFFVCRNSSGRSLSFNCPSGLESEKASHEAMLLCSVRGTVQETFVSKPVVFDGALAYFGAAGFTGIFSLERFSK